MASPRIQALEINDSERAPAFVRETIVESLSRALRWGGMSRAMVAPLGGSFVWEYGHCRYPPLGKGTYFDGVPRR